MTTPTTPSSETGLKRSVGFLAATGSGVAIIVGAGVYVLMGEAAGRAGNALWLSFALAGTAALFTGLSYAELSAAFPKAAAGYNYTRAAFGERPAFVVGWLTLLSQVVSVSAVALGFGAYLQDKLAFPQLAAALLLTVACCIIAYRSVRESTLLGSSLAVLEVGGLVLIIVGGISHFGSVNYLEMPKGVAGIFSGASLLFFAFLGFEQVADLAQEIKNPGRNLPLAILGSGGISAILYVTASISAVSILGWAALSSSEAPLAAVANTALGAWASSALSAIALLATASTVLIAVVAATRTLYGMSAGGSLPKLFSAVHSKRGTPWAATLGVALVAVIGIFPRDISLVAEITNFAILLVFLAVNLSLIVLRRKLPSHPRPFRVPFAVAGIPVIPVLGIVTAAFLLANVGLRPALYGLGITALFVLAALAKSRFE